MKENRGCTDGVDEIFQTIQRGNIGYVLSHLSILSLFFFLRRPWAIIALRVGWLNLDLKYSLCVLSMYISPVI